MGNPLDIFANIKNAFDLLNGLNFTDLNAKLDEAGAFLDKFAKLGETFGQFAGPYAGAVVVASTAFDAMYQAIIAEHHAGIAAGVPADQQTAQTLVKVANAAAASGLIKDQNTVNEIQAITATVGTIPVHG